MSRYHSGLDSDAAFTSLLSKARRQALVGSILSLALTALSTAAFLSFLHH